jgi:hypothetical protein
MRRSGKNRNNDLKTFSNNLFPYKLMGVITRLESSMAMKIQVAVFWTMTPCSVVVGGEVNMEAGSTEM